MAGPEETRNKVDYEQIERRAMDAGRADGPDAYKSDAGNDFPFLGHSRTVVIVTHAANTNLSNPTT